MNNSDIPTISAVKSAVNQRLASFYSDMIAKSETLDAGYATFWREIADLSQAGGKRLRPYLVCLAHQAFGGEYSAAVLDVAVAQELLHASLLMHDDIIDKDYTRYGRLNIAGVMQQKYQTLTSEAEAQHYAAGAALLAGDLLISEAYQIIIASELSDAQKLVALQCLGDAIFGVGGGELLDMEAVLRPADAHAALVIADLKTARYSIVAPLVAGASLAHASTEDIQNLTTIGIALGIAYQLVDDMLGVFGNESDTGKSVISDIREGKPTYLMSKTFELATAEQTATLRNYFGNANLNVEQAAEVRDIIMTTGAYDDAERIIEQYTQQALDGIETLAIDESAKHAFRALVQTATERSK